MKARFTTFGVIEIASRRYDHDVVIDGGQIRKRIKRRSRHRVTRIRAPRRIFQLRMLMLVAVGAEQFPVAAIRRVVVVVAVFVMHFE